MRRTGKVAVFMAGALAVITPAVAGHAPDSFQLATANPGEIQSSPERASPRGARRSTCDRLQTLVGKLGETFAGYRLRQTWTARICAMTNHAFDDGIWSWPWAIGAAAPTVANTESLNRDLPPRLLRTFGAWDIRCGRVGTRQRCALIRSDVLHRDDGTTGVRVVSHFVIDAVAGREIVLWRVFVAQPMADDDAISIVLPGRIVRKPFDQCMQGGCLMEAALAVSAAVVTELWQGQSIEFRLSLPPVDATIVLPSLGFREGLGELTRMRREDRGLTANGIVP